MDKSKRKGLKKQYKAQTKQRELVKLAENEASLFNGFAQIELGKDLPSITVETIKAATVALDLTEKLYQKIVEKAHRSKPKSKSIFNSGIENMINKFSPYLQAVYHTYLFECAINTGGIDKEFAYEGGFEKKQLDEKLDKLMAAYQLMENKKMLTLIKRARSADNYDALQEIATIYQPEEINEHRLEFIKRNWEEFEMK